MSKESGSGCTQGSDQGTIEDKVEVAVIRSIILGCHLAITPAFRGFILGILEKRLAPTTTATIDSAGTSGKYMEIGSILPGNRDDWMAVVGKSAEGWNVAYVPPEVVREALRQFPPLLAKMAFKARWADDARGFLLRLGQDDIHLTAFLMKFPG